MATNTHEHNQQGLKEYIPLELREDAVSGLNNCQSVNARNLCFLDIGYRLQNNEQYDIGGTYTNNEPDLWFYYTTSQLPANNYLLNIFVNHRKSGTFSISISDICTNEIQFEHENKPGKAYYPECPQYTFLTKSMAWKTFTSPRDNMSHHIKTYFLKESHLKELGDKILCLPITVKINPKELDKSTIQGIKKNYENINSSIKQSKPDFILKSKTNNEYPMHRIFLIAHSPVFRDVVRKDPDIKECVLNIKDEQMELLIEFLYTGKVVGIEKDIVELQKIAYDYQIDGLLMIICETICKKVTVENAIELAILSEKYNLETLQKTIFKFISENSAEVMKTEGWNNLNDAALTKKMLKVFYSSH